jgi:putative acetyltransferase
MVRVREMQEPDTAAVARVHEAAARDGAASAYQDPGRWTRDREPSDYLDDVRDPDITMLVAEVDETVVGFGGADLDEGTVVADYVHPDYQDRGVGTALLTRLETALADAGHDVVTLTASLNALPFYERRGYETLERTTLDEAAVTFPVVEMRRELDC